MSNEFGTFMDGDDCEDCKSYEKDLNEARSKVFDEMGKRIKLIEENDKLRQCLESIANEDYRGNRSNASVKAHKCLKDLKYR